MDSQQFLSLYTSFFPFQFSFSLTFPFLTFFALFTSVAHAFDRVKKEEGTREGKTGGAAEIVGRTALLWALNICYK